MKVKFNVDVFYIACMNGQLDVSKWLLKIHPRLYQNVNINYIFRVVAKNGHLDMVKWLLKEFPMLVYI